MPEELDIRAAIATASDAPFAVTAVKLKAPAANEIRVRIVATSICHTDLMTKGKALCAFPIVLGHEGVGVVDALGRDVSGFDIGDHVILSYDSCGNCPQCDIAKPSYCDNHGSLNFAGTRPSGEKTHRSSGSDEADIFGSFFQQSSFATYALSHTSNTIKVDKSLPLATLAPLGCGVQTGAGTVFNTLQVVADSSLAVFGCGCVGLSAIMAAKIAGARNIIAIDVNTARLDMAMELGATHRIAPEDFSDSNALVEHIKALSERSGCQYAIDTTGIPDVLHQAFDCCGPLGVTAMIAPGVPGTEVSVEMLGLLPGKSLRGVIQGDSVSKEFIPKLIEHWQRGEFPFNKLITEYSGIDNIEAAASAMASGDVIKPVVIVDTDFQA
ncbi:MAG: NAD(P)-dependent alcohol dehydrogenase [Woeseiaceae bacterium]